MITIDISKCHCEVLKEAIWEAIPNAQDTGIDVNKAIKVMKASEIAGQDTIHFSIEEDAWNCILEILRHHPQPTVGDFFIHHMEDLAADSQLGYSK